MRRIGRSKAWRLAATISVLGAGALGLSSCIGSSSTYGVTAIFPSAEGLFAGNSVEVLGVPSGSVTSVTPEAGRVVVTMAVDSSQSLPAAVHATLTNPQLLGEPSIELSPGYSGGPRLAAGSVIPMDRTSVPASINRLLKDLQTYLGEVNTSSVAGLVTNLSQDLQGQGQALNALIANGAGTLQTLASQGNNLGQLNQSLAAITGTLRQRTTSVTQLLQSYDQVAGVLAAQSQPLGDAITQLAQTSSDLAQLLTPNLSKVQGEVGTITQVGRTLDRNLGSLDQGLASSVSLFAAAQRAYDPVNKWLNLNTQLAPGTTSGVLAGLVRDRLAGICRRVLANHSAGLSSAQIATLNTCGNPDSGFFDPILGLVPSVLNQVSGGSSPTPQSLLAQGATQIPGLNTAQKQSISQVSPSQLSGGAPSGLGSGAKLPPPSPSQTDQQANSGSSSGSGGLGGLLHGLLGAMAGVMLFGLRRAVQFIGSIR
ncbi:MAG: MCE family protein [Acidimicrobiales bacterium]